MENEWRFSKEEVEVLDEAERSFMMRQMKSDSAHIDVVGRGIDVSGISHIINYDIPEYHDDYVHRVGRTGRLSSAEKGVAITFVMRDQGDQLTNIEKRINRMLPEYKVDDYKAFQPRAPRPTVEAKPKVSFA